MQEVPADLMPQIRLAPNNPELITNVLMPFTLFSKMLQGHLETQVIN
jgi:hypothetical protein